MTACTLTDPAKLAFDMILLFGQQFTEQPVQIELRESRTLLRRPLSRQLAFSQAALRTFPLP